MGLYASNCKISGPADVAVSADVDFNGLQWSYVAGLVFPQGASVSTIPVQLPGKPKTWTPGSM
jgi:hypothetical protein